MTSNSKSVTLTGKQASLIAFISGIGFGALITQILDRTNNNKKQNNIKMRNSNTMPSIDSIQDSDNTTSMIQHLMEENGRLSNLVAIVGRGGYDISSRKKLTPSDIETIRAIFNSIDEDKDGHVSPEQFKELHSKLGEPLTDKEAEEALMMLDPKKKNSISFEAFLNFWSKQHSGGKSNKSYAKKFKFLSSKIRGDFKYENIITKSIGNKYTTEYRINFHYEQPNGELKRISPWHDIPLHRLDKSNTKTHIYNFVCEVPKYTRAKFEIATGEPFNPIKQDTKNGKLRYYQHGDMMFNYGALPQTYEDPNKIPKETGLPGDNDPLDAIELGTKQLDVGTVTAVKCLGVLALLDSGETDWKILCINIADPLANRINDVHGIDKHLPGAIDAIREFLRIYKVCTGSEENKYAFGGEALNKEDAMKVIEDAHSDWKELKAQNRTVI